MYYSVAAYNHFVSNGSNTENDMQRYTAEAYRLISSGNLTRLATLDIWLTAILF